ncbi:CLUMA_CG008737, isoform A [Clunio marinus]|uniref:CLUMA_CG008737, isoform A n=1 Tax=Clunio marinus TaxID=568069 RepID=A0A1J1I4J4_9DIPT|nr:CLUMA_CG008737, isoform A [Clunio marinus]
MLLERKMKIVTKEIMLKLKNEEKSTDLECDSN